MMKHSTAMVEKNKNYMHGLTIFKLDHELVLTKEEWTFLTSPKWTMNGPNNQLSYTKTW